MPFSEKIKFKVKKLSHQTCCVCKSIGIEIHHITPQSENGSDELNNAAPLCPSCHEIYGQNPTKRKFIRESRDIWYEICEKRFQIPATELAEIRKKVTLIESGIQDILKPKTDSNKKALTIGSIYDFYIQTPFPTDEKFLRHLDVTFTFVFGTMGDPENEEDIAFNSFRDFFLSYFGELFSQKFILHNLNSSTLDWKNGVTELELAEFLSQIKAAMYLTMMNFDLEIFDEKIEARINENKELEYIVQE